jgi:hypothetical protein
MRGGAIPVLVWAVLLSILTAINWIWTNDHIQLYEWLYAVLVILAIAVALVLLNRAAIRRGPPEPPRRARALLTLPDLSFGAPLAAVAVAAGVFGLVFGHFFIYFGFGLLAIALGRLGVELRSARRSTKRWRARPEGEAGEADRRR